MQSQLSERLAERLQLQGVTAPPLERIRSHELYFALLAKWNRTINLTALALEPPTDEAIDRLLVEPIVAANFAGRETLEGHNHPHVIDIGSGGGSPAIPFWIEFQGSTLTMVESRARKCAFLREAVRQIRPGAGTALDTRFEDLLTTYPHLESSADIVTVRAVRLDSATSQMIGRLLKPSGRVFHFVSKLEVFTCSTWNNRDKELG